MKNPANRYRPPILALLVLLTGSAAAEGTWIDYGLLPDGTMYQWRLDNAIKVSSSVREVWSRTTYNSPHPIPTIYGESDRYARHVLTTQRVSCKAQTVQVMSVSYYSMGDDEDVILSNNHPQAAAPAKPGTVGGRLLESVCKTLKSG